METKEDVEALERLIGQLQSLHHPVSGPPRSPRPVVYSARRRGLYFVGPCRTRLLYTGNGGGWLTSFHDDVEAEILDSYFEDGRTQDEHAATQPLQKGEIAEFFVDEILDWEEWDSYSSDERAEILAEGDTRFDYCTIDQARLLERVESGQPILK